MTKIHQFKQNGFINLNGNLYDLNSSKIMGIINCTPDSFYSESRKTQIVEILKTVESMLENGADIIDIGGASTRPNAILPAVDEEIERIYEPIKAIRKEFKNIIISLDTTRSEVAKVGIDEGISIVNDVSGGFQNADLIEIVAQKKIPYILTFNSGNEINTSPLASERNILRESLIFFSERLQKLKNAGINDIIIDPGFGFDKTLEENFSLVDNLDFLKILEKPILVGFSRKSMIYRKLGIAPEESLNGSTILNTVAFLKNASIFRVHDVKEMSQIRQLLNS